MAERELDDLVGMDSGCRQEVHGVCVRCTHGGDVPVVIKTCKVLGVDADVDDDLGPVVRISSRAKAKLPSISYML